MGIRDRQGIDAVSQGVVTIAGLAADLEGQVQFAAVLTLLLQVLTHVLKVGDQGAVAILLSLLDDAGDGLLAVDVETDILGVHGSLPGTRFLWRSRNDHVLGYSNLSLGGSNFIAYAGGSGAEPLRRTGGVTSHGYIPVHMATHGGDLHAVREPEGLGRRS